MRSPFQIWPHGDNVLEFGGGGGPSAAEQEKARKQQEAQDKAFQKMLAQMSRPVQLPAFSVPAAPKPVAIPPPPTQQRADIEDAQYEARRAAAKRYGFMKTTYAGSTGGYMATPLGSSNAGGAAVLG